MNLDKFAGSGSTPARRRFWDQVVDSVLASQKVEGKNVSVDERQGGTVINVARNAGTAATCPTGDTVMVTFSGVESCGCLSGSGQSFMGTDLGGINAAFTLTRFSPTEFSFTDTLFNFKEWESDEGCPGSPDIDENNDCIVYARCIEASGLWTVSIQDTVTFYFAFFASDATTTLTNESTCSPFLNTDLFHNGTATVTF